MIYNLPLHLKEKKKDTPTARVIAMPGQGNEQYSLYMGNDALHTRLTTGVSRNNITVHTIGLARQTIKMYLQQGISPEFIICCADNLDDVEPLLRFVQRYQALKTVPFFVYKEDMLPEDREAIRRLGGVDDVLTDKTTGTAFRVKFDFATRLRSHAGHTEAMLFQKKLDLNRGINHLFKRVFDVACSSAALLLLLPFLLLIAIAIKLESKGPIFYISKRAGTNYRVFKFYKFRTMVADADKKVDAMKHLNQYSADDKGPVFFKVSNDPRITRLGAFLRNTSLDELPQLLNVLLGDMSLVGNRPLPLYEAATLTTDNYAGRFAAPAGITGLWQIKKRGSGNMSVDERIRLDIDYAERHSFLYDMWIVANTPSALVQKENV